MALFGTYGITSVEDLVGKWDEGFKEVYCSSTFIPLMDDEKGEAFFAFAIATIDKAMLEELIKLGKGQRRKMLKKRGLRGSPIYPIRLLDPLDALVAYCAPPLEPTDEEKCLAAQWGVT